MAEPQDQAFMSAYGELLLERQRESLNNNKMTIKIDDLDTELLRRFFDAGWNAHVEAAP